MPADSAVPGMSSTPSISAIRKSWSPGRTGAKPTPQLPITIVVTPCQHDGESSESQVALPVVVGVDVDDPGQHEFAARVDRLARCAEVVTHRRDAIAGERDVGLRAGAAPVPSTSVPPR